MSAALATSSDDQVSFAILLARVWRRWWWVVLTVAVCAAAFGLVALSMPKIYRASTVVVLATPPGSMGGSLGSSLGSIGGLASLVGVDLNAGQNDADELIAILTSRQFIENFIEEKRLLPVLFAEAWDKTSGKWIDEQSQPTLVQGYMYFKGKVLDVERDKSTQLIKLNIDWTEGTLAAEWANELVERLNNEMRSRALDQADRSVRYLERELERTSMVGTQQAISRLMETQINQRMLANVTAEYALRVVDRALAPDPRYPVRPRVTLMVALGFVLGGAIGLFLVWFVPEKRAGKA